MKVRLKTTCKHDGQWKPPGAILDLDNNEAAALMARGLCYAVEDESTVTDAAEQPKTDTAQRRGRPKKGGE